MSVTPVEIARRAFAGRPASSAELLKRYASARDPEAFAGLVRQFGPLVLGVCRRALGPSAEVDDAFQTVFLALARQASSFRDAAALPAWLHRVALRTARKTSARHRPLALGTHELADPTDPFASVTWKDVRRALDEELDALPDKLRSPVVLCWLDGLTRDEAAAALGVSLNTLKRRLSEGRELLRERLTRRGLAPTLVAGAVLAPNGLRADVPRALIEAVTNAARHVRPRGAVFGWVVAVAVAACGMALITAGHAPPETAPPPRPATVLNRPDGVPDVPLPPGAIARFGSTHFRSPGWIFSAALSPDGTRLALGDGLTVRVYESTTWRLLHTLAANGGPDVWRNRPSLAFSPDGKKLAYAQNGNLALTWDLTTGRLMHRFDRDGWVWQGFCAFTPAGLLALSDEEELRFFDPATGAEKHAVSVPNAVALSADGKHYVRHSGRAGPGTLVLGSSVTGTDLHRFDTAVDSSPEVSFSPDGTQLVLMTRYGAGVEVWDVAKRALVKRLPVPPQPTICERPGCGTAFTPDGREIWLKLPGHGIVRWDVATFLELPRFAIEASELSLTVAPLPDGRTVLVPCQTGCVRVLDRRTGQERAVPGRYGDSAVFARSPDDKFVAVGDASGRIDLLDAATGKPARVVRGSGAPVCGLVFGPNGRTLGAAEVVYDSADLTKDRAAVRVYDTTDGKELWAQKRDGAKGSDQQSRWLLRPLGFTTADRVIVSQHPHGTAVWDIKTGRQTGPLAVTGLHASLSPDGTLLATEERGEAVITDVATGRETVRVAVDPEEKTNRRFAGTASFGWSGDGDTLAVSAPGGSVCLIDPRKGHVRTRINVARGGDWRFSFLQQPPCEPFLILALALSPNGQQLLASGRGGYYVALWDTSGKGKRLAKLECEFAVASAAFRSDGKRVFTFGGDGLGYSWDVEKLIAAPKR